MSVRVGICVRVLGAAVLLLSSMFAASASAQTTVVFDAPADGVQDAFIRAGAYANRVNNTGVLVTRLRKNATTNSPRTVP